MTTRMADPDLQNDFILTHFPSVAGRKAEMESLRIAFTFAVRDGHFRMTPDMADEMAKTRFRLDMIDTYEDSSFAGPSPEHDFMVAGILLFDRLDTAHFFEKNSPLNNLNRAFKNELFVSTVHEIWASVHGRAFEDSCNDYSPDPEALFAMNVIVAQEVEQYIKMPDGQLAECRAMLLERRLPKWRNVLPSRSAIGQDVHQRMDELAARLG